MPNTPKPPRKSASLGRQINDALEMLPNPRTADAGVVRLIEALPIRGPKDAGSTPTNYKNWDATGRGVRGLSATASGNQSARVRSTALNHLLSMTASEIEQMQLWAIAGLGHVVADQKYTKEEAKRMVDTLLSTARVGYRSQRGIRDSIDVLQAIRENDQLLDTGAQEALNAIHAVVQNPELRRRAALRHSQSGVFVHVPDGVRELAKTVLTGFEAEKITALHQLRQDANRGSIKNIDARPVASAMKIAVLGPQSDAIKSGAREVLDAMRHCPGDASLYAAVAINAIDEARKPPLTEPSSRGTMSL